MKHLKRFLIFNLCLVLAFSVVYLISLHDFNIPTRPSETHEELTNEYWNKAYWRYRYSRDVRIRKRFRTVTPNDVLYLCPIIDEYEDIFKDECEDYDFYSDCVNLLDRWYVKRDANSMVMYYYDKETQTMYKIRTKQWVEGKDRFEGFSVSGPLTPRN